MQRSIVRKSMASACSLAGIALFLAPAVVHSKNPATDQPPVDFSWIENPAADKPAAERPAEEVEAVKVQAAAVEWRLGKAHPLHVIIENRTNKPQKHFEEWNSWGYGNITIEWTDAAGKTGKVAKVAGNWDKNFAGTMTLQAGEALVRDVTFDPALWAGWPDVQDATPLTIKITYESKVDPQLRADTGAWAGKVVSKPQVITLWPREAK